MTTPVHETRRMEERLRSTRPGAWRPGLLGDGPQSRGARAMVQVLSSYRGGFGVTVLCGVGNQLTQVLGAVVAAFIVGLAVTGAPTAEVVPWVGVAAALVAARAAFLWGEAWVGHDLAFRMLAEVRMWLYRAFERIGPLALVRRRSADLLARATSDAEGLEVFYAHTAIYVATTAVLTPALLVGAGVMVGPSYALALLPVVLATLVVPLVLRRRNVRQGHDLRDRTAQVGIEIADTVTGLREVLAFGQGDARRDRILAAGRSLERAERRQALRGGMESAATEVVLGAGVVVSLVLAVRLRVADDLDPAMVPVAVALGVSILVPVVTLLATTRVTGISNASARRVFDLLAAPRSTPHPAEPGPLPPRTGPARSVEVDDVWFRYGPDLPWVLRGVDLSVAPGETVALVGASGAGKSTLGHLLLRYADPERGTVRIDGVPVADLAPEDLVSAVAHVPQDVFCFHLTLAENLRLAAPEATDAELVAACAAAGLDEVVAGLPQGLATVVGERGTRLSGGERQRVAIARALLRDAPVLVMDEAASQLDPLREQSIADALDRVRAGRTTIVIAHRLSTIRRADRVVVLDAGRVVASGTHAELESSLAYRRLVAAQPRPPSMGGTPPGPEEPRP